MKLGELAGRVLKIARLLPGELRASSSRRGWAAALPKEVVRFWGGDPETVRVLAAAKNALFTFRAGERDLVLKLSDVEQRAVASVAAEAHFVEHLARAGVAVCAPVRSSGGQYAERVDLPRRGSFAALVVEKAEGVPVDAGEIETWPASLVEHWGEIAGEMHAAAKTFVPAPGENVHLMISLETLAFAQRILGTKDAELLGALAAVVRKLADLPRDRDSFGMVHGDLTSANVFRSGDRLTIFDFESASWCWYVYDLASPVYAALVFGGALREEAGYDAAAQFFRSFATGYVRRNVLPAALVARLPDFLSFLALLNVVLFYHRGERGNARRFLRIVRELTGSDDAAARIDFGGIYEDVLAARAGRISSPQ